MQADSHELNFMSRVQEKFGGAIFNINSGCPGCKAKPEEKKMKVKNHDVSTKYTKLELILYLHVD